MFFEACTCGVGASRRSVSMERKVRFGDVRVKLLPLASSVVFGLS
jgi:hypothetical protein